MKLLRESTVSIVDRIPTNIRTAIRNRWVHVMKICSPPTLPVHLLPARRHVREENRLTVVLDMDETLLHSTVLGEVSTDVAYDSIVEDMSKENTFGVQVRPRARAFLEFCASHFELVVFTAAAKEYAQPVLDWLIPEHIHAHRLYRDSCLEVGGTFVKPIDTLGRDLCRVVLVDNNMCCMLSSPDNGLLIPSFYGGSTDTAIEHVANILTYLHICDDVRPFLSSRFRVREQLLDRGLTPLDST